MPINLFSICTAILPFIFSGLVLIPTISTAANNPPDFSGASATYWGNPGAAGGPSRLMGGEIKLVPAAEKARQDFISVSEGTNHGAGNSCVGGGMQRQFWSLLPPYFYTSSSS